MQVRRIVRALERGGDERRGCRALCNSRGAGQHSGRRRCVHCRAAWRHRTGGAGADVTHATAAIVRTLDAGAITVLFRAACHRREGRGSRLRFAGNVHKAHESDNGEAKFQNVAPHEIILQRRRLAASGQRSTQSAAGWDRLVAELERRRSGSLVVAVQALVLVSATEIRTGGEGIEKVRTRSGRRHGKPRRPFVQQVGEFAPERRQVAQLLIQLRESFADHSMHRAARSAALGALSQDLREIGERESDRERPLDQLDTDDRFRPVSPVAVARPVWCRPRVPLRGFRRRCCANGETQSRNFNAVALCQDVDLTRASARRTLMNACLVTPRRRAS